MLLGCTSAAIVLSCQLPHVIMIIMRFDNNYCHLAWLAQRQATVLRVPYGESCPFADSYRPLQLRHTKVQCYDGAGSYSVYCTGDHFAGLRNDCHAAQRKRHAARQEDVKAS